MRIKRIVITNKQIYIGLLIFIVITTIFITSIISLDMYHHKHCNIENCTKCINISSAIGFIRNIINKIKNINYLDIAISMFILINIKKIRENINTLVEKKVQFNE